MIETIRLAEYEWFLWLNSFHTPIFDTFMFWITYRFTWIPLYLYILFFLFQNAKKILRSLLFILFSVGLADRITSGIIKPYFQRLRPCHDPSIQELVHVVGNCGGQYGFVSSHASNSFALAVSLFIVLKTDKIKTNRFVLLFFWATLVSYSRVYVGVHFATDILLGGLIGSLIPLLLKPLLLAFNQLKINT
jgi:undecaprenyl-diphosphatase